MSSTPYDPYDPYDPGNPFAAPETGGPAPARGRKRRRSGIGPAATMGLVLFAAFTLLGGTVAVMAVNVFVGASQGLPDPSLLEKVELPEQSVIYDRTGTVDLARFGDYNRQTVTYAELPPVLVDATTSIEDRTFWDNSGVDPVGILAAARDAILGRPRGASTITQQLVRQRLLSSDGSAQVQQTFDRKVKEIIQSIRVTQAYPGVEGKQRIMAAYLNQNYYGNESYGVAAAAQAYFGVGLKDLTLAQAAILAALPKAPSSYDLVQNAVEECVDPAQTDETCTKTQLVVPPDTAIVARRNQVLAQMERSLPLPLTGTTYTPAEFEAAIAEKVVLAPQRSNTWRLPQFVWQVRRELTNTLCGDGVDTCPQLERGGLQVITTIDMRLQGLAEKWVKAAAIVPHAANPKQAAKALGLSYEPWMANLRSKSLRNGALIAIDYQTGQILAYQGSADPTSTKANKKFQPRFDVLADGWRQPGSAFKPIVYGTGINNRSITAASMFMDVVTDFGGGYTPTDADMLERGPLRVRDALRFSLNVPAVKSMAVIGNANVQKTAQDMGVVFRADTAEAGLAFALGVEEVHPKDLVRAYGTLANGGVLVPQTTILEIKGVAGGMDVTGDPQGAGNTQAIEAGSAAIVTDILAGNTDPKQNPYWGKFAITDGGKRRPATLKTGTNNDAKDLNAYGYIGAPSAKERASGEYALAVGAWNGNSDNSLVSTSGAPLFSIDVTTYVWQGFLEDATAGWSINGFAKPSTLEQVAVDPWTGLAADAGGKSITELFLPGTAPKGGLPADQRCGEAVLQAAGFEKDYGSWMAADQAWLKRAAKGPGTRNPAQGTRISYFFNGAFNPYGKSWGPLLGGGAGCASPSPSPSTDPCASPDPSASIDPLATVDPLATPVACPSPSESPSASPTDSPTPEKPSQPRVKEKKCAKMADFGISGLPVAGRLLN
ncbi:MAG: transglycosylase domain-containing protein, partial [Chloroflexota bacterium]